MHRTLPTAIAAAAAAVVALALLPATAATADTASASAPVEVSTSAAAEHRLAGNAVCKADVTATTITIKWDFPQQITTPKADFVGGEISLQHRGSTISKERVSTQSGQQTFTGLQKGTTYGIRCSGNYKIRQTGWMTQYGGGDTVQTLHAGPRGTR